MPLEWCWGFAADTIQLAPAAADVHWIAALQCLYYRVGLQADSEMAMALLEATSAAAEAAARVDAERREAEASKQVCFTVIACVVAVTAYAAGPEILGVHEEAVACTLSCCLCKLQTGG